MKPSSKLLQITLLIGLLVILTGCGLLETPTPEIITQFLTQEVEVTVQVEKILVVTATSPPPTSTPVPDLIFVDEFENDTSGWSTTSTDNIDRFYKDGQFHMSVAPNAGGWASNDELESIDDFILDLDIAQIAGNVDDAVVGVMFRYKDRDNYYLFVLMGDGSYVFAQRLSGDFDIIGIAKADHINKLSEGNHVQIIAKDNSLSASVNGVLTAYILDDTFTRGDINLYASSDKNAQIEAVFDNLVVQDVR